MIIVYLGLNIEQVTAQHIIGRDVVYGYDPEQRAVVYGIDQTIRLMIEYSLHPVNQIKKLVKEINWCKDHWDLIITTHSQDIVNYLGEMIATQKLNHAEVSIKIIADDLSKITHEPTFNEQGILTNWPYGFFDYTRD